MTTNKATFIIT